MQIVVRIERGKSQQIRRNEHILELILLDSLFAVIDEDHRTHKSQQIRWKHIIFIYSPTNHEIPRTNERTNERKKRTKLERSKSLSPRCGTGRRDPEVWEPREYQISVGRVRKRKRREEKRRGGGGGEGGGFRSCVCSLWRGLRRRRRSSSM